MGIRKAAESRWMRSPRRDRPLARREPSALPPSLVTEAPARDRVIRKCLAKDAPQTVIGLAERNRRVAQLITASAGEPVRIAEGNVALSRSRLSSDGRWVAYQSGQSGQPQIYV